MDERELHHFLRKATIRICNLPEEDVAELDAEVSEAVNKDVTRT
jgi:hypothetical protein